MTADSEVGRDREQALWRWFPEFLRRELAPYPGRRSLVARMVVSATLSMIVIVTFRIPYGAIGVNCAFILSRENLTSTAKSGFYFILAFAAWAALMPIGARMFASIAITHFIWEGVTAFLCFFLLKTLNNLPLATGVVVVATATMAIWYLPGPAELNVELTLWQILATSIGALITFLVEVVFRSWSSEDVLKDGIDERLRALEDMLHAYGGEGRVPSTLSDLVARYAMTGNSMLRQSIARNHSVGQQRVKMNAVLSLLGRGMDLSAAFVSSQEELGSGGRAYAEGLAMRICAIRKALLTEDEIVADTSGKRAEKGVPALLTELAATVGLMGIVLRTCQGEYGALMMLDESGAENHIFIKDAFTNPEYLKYALAGTAASMLCYVIYVAMNWPGISTAVTTCVLTALSNIGSSRQKQILRFVGASIGGFVLGLGSQIFVLPYLDSIVGLTILFACATAVSAYVATSSPRLSYVGLQMAFAFYLINVTDFSISLDLTIGRDRAVGVLLGTCAMWLVFERLYARPAAVEMVAGLVRATRLIAGLTSPDGQKMGSAEAERINSVRATVSDLFTHIGSEADAVFFEGGTRRQSLLAARGRVIRWLSTLRTVYLLELPLLQARLDGGAKLRSEKIRETDEYLCGALATTLNQIADCLENQLERTMRDRSGSELQSTTAVLRGHNRPLEILLQTDKLSPALKMLATLVNELERDVSSYPVFAPQVSTGGNLQAAASGTAV